MCGCSCWSGMQLHSDLLLQEAWPIALAVIALHAGRAVAVYGCFGALHLAGDRVPWRWQHVMVFGNVKGALSMAAVLALPQGIAYRERLIAIVFGVTLVTLVTQALPFRRFLTWLGVAGRRRGRSGRRVPGGPDRRAPRPDRARQPAGVGPHLAPRARRALGGVPARHHRGRARACAGSGELACARWRCRRCCRRARRPFSMPRAAA